MKYASAMKYGGELVAAVDCDYSSFKELVPLCPNCKEPVYLRSGGQRESVKGKAYQIGPHWCHFKGISAEQVSGCELRVNGYTEKDRAKIAAQARGQRLKLLQRWFWRVFSTRLIEAMNIPSSAVNDPRLEKAMQGVVRDDDGDRCSLIVTFPCSLSWENKSSIEVEQGNRFESDSEGAAMFEKAMGAPCDGILLLPFGESTPKAIFDYSVQSPRSVNLHYARYIAESVWVPSDLKHEHKPSHLKVCIEVHIFLMANQNRDLLISVIGLVMKMVSYSPGVGGWFSKQICDRYHPADVVTSAIAMSIASIPWASEFQRLEAEAKQRKDAA